MKGIYNLHGKSGEQYQTVFMYHPSFFYFLSPLVLRAFLSNLSRSTLKGAHLLPVSCLFPFFSLKLKLLQDPN